MRKFYKLTGEILVSILLAMVLFFIPTDEISAAASSGIKGNGTAGISIDVNGEPYKSFQNLPYGNYAYGPYGCAWFASARVKQLTGVNCIIHSGSSWYYSAYRTYGFSRGAEIREKSIVCYSGHVAIIEKIEGNTVYISEGGSTYYSDSAHGYTCIRATTIDALRKSNGKELGYVYLPGASSTSDIAYKNMKTESVDSRNACLYGEIHNPNRLTVSKVGAYVWDAAGNAIVSHSEACGRNNSVIYQRLNIVSEARPQGLKSGAKYTYQFYAVVNGKTFYSGKSSFTTVDNESPKITNVRITNITSDGYTVSCTVTDNAGVNRVQFPTWTMANGQDDIVPDWGRDTRVRGTKNGNTYTFHVKRSDHNYEYGRYRTDIYAYDNSGNEICVQGDEVILQAKEAVSLNRTSITFSALGQKMTLIATVTPSSVKDKSVTWSSSNTSVATVSGSGVVTAISSGTAIITVKTKQNGATARCTVTVTKDALKPGSTRIKISGKTTDSLTLKWNKASGATGYIIYYYSEYDRTVRTLEVYRGRVSLRMNGLEPGTRYYFAIQPRHWTGNEYIYGDCSSYVRGTTTPERAVIKKVSVSGGKIKVTLAGHAAGADKYAMCYSTKPDFRDYKVGIRTVYTSRTMTPKFRKGTYYVKVRSYKELGNGQRVYGEWSNRMKVVVN